jgi:N-acetylneuraminic acid mutarotase
MALAASGAAQAAWSGADSLATARYNHTATLLKDGRVLVAGGNDSGPLAGARLYDPTANAWSNAAPMNDARQGHAAVLLRSGNVLVAGGFAPTAEPVSPSSDYTRTAEIYDPATNTWRKAANMTTGRFKPTMTVLEDGRVLVAGGSGDLDTGHGVNAAVPLASAEIYDPATDSWSDVPSMSVARAMATATLLPSGKVLVAGGYDDASGDLSSAELFDPSTDTWSSTGSLADARDSATATALPDGDVLVAGGDGGADHALAGAELYHPESGTWHAAASMAGARQSAAAALLADGTVLVTGGEDGRFGTVLDTTERYDPAVDAWQDGGTMVAARKDHTVTALDDGRALVVGGNPGGFDGGLSDVDRFSAAATTVTAVSFGGRLVGTSSAVETAVLTNTGDAPLVPTLISIAGAGAKDFEILSESCRGSSIAPGDTCRIDVRFTPTAAGPRGAALTVADNTAAGTTTAPLIGAGQSPAPVTDATTPGAGVPAGASGATGGAVQMGGTAGAGPQPRSGVASERARGGAPRATCTVKTARRHGCTRSTVTCRMTWRTSAAVALSARLMQGRTRLVSARATARAGHAVLRLRPARRLRSGHYTLVIARRDGTTVLRQAIRVS